MKQRKQKPEPAGAGSVKVRLILASRSPRRAELLREAGYDFETVPAAESAEPTAIPGESAESLVRRAALAKAMDVVRQLAPDGPPDMDPESPIPRIVVGCDTVAALDDKILGKPANRDDARRMLQELSGSCHECVSGLCLWNLATDQVVQRIERSVLRMKRLTDAQIETYLDSGMWEGKAGAYGIQDGPDWLRLESGSLSGVAGLPITLLAEMLDGMQP